MDCGKVHPLFSVMLLAQTQIHVFKENVYITLAFGVNVCVCEFSDSES